MRGVFPPPVGPRAARADAAEIEPKTALGGRPRPAYEVPTVGVFSNAVPRFARAPVSAGATRVRD